MKPLLILLTLFLTACESTTTIEQINKAISLCEANGGLNHIYTDSATEAKIVFCNNSARFDMKPKD